MKKIKLLFMVLILIPSFSYACVCAIAVFQSFTNVSTEVTKSLGEHYAQLKILEKNIDNSINALKEQNENIQTSINLNKLLSLKEQNLIFLLSQKIELEK